MLHDDPVLSNRDIFRKEIWREAIGQKVTVDLTTPQLTAFNRTLLANTTLLDFRDPAHVEHRVSSPIHMVQVLSRHTCGVICADREANSVKGIGLRVNLLKRGERAKLSQVLHHALGHEVDISSVPIKLLQKTPISLFTLLYQTSLCATGGEGRVESRVARDIQQFGVVLILCKMAQKDPSHFLLCESNFLDEFARRICQGEPLRLTEK